MTTPPGAASVAACPVCRSQEIATLIEIPSVPIHCNLLWPSQAQARSAPRGTIQLAFCRTCTHVFNQAFDPALMEYTQGYENSLHFSPRFQAYAEALARRLVEQHQLRNRTIVEIGSGTGEFLTLLCQLGDNRGFGFDPSYLPEPATQADRRVTFIQDFYTPRSASYNADMVVCRHVLEHIQHPASLLLQVRHALGDRPDATIYVEVPNVLFMLRDLSIWDIIYEHCSYFSAGSLAYTLHAAGFAIERLTEEFGGQFLAVDAHPVRIDVAPAAHNSETTGQLAGAAARFAASYHQRLDTWRARLAHMASAGQRAVIWGAGSKGVTFLNVLGITEEIAYAIDINPRKHGMHIAGTGQPIVPPEHLRSYRPDTIVIMNAIYRDEIESTAAALGLDAEIICV